MKLIDTHAHIYDQAFDDDRRQVIEEAQKSGIVKILMPAIDSQTHQEMFELARNRPDMCLPMMGLHPTSVNDNPRWRQELDIVERHLANPPHGIAGFYAVGEVGIDLYWSTEWENEQIEAFERQIETAIALGLPLAIHTRAAWPQMIRTLAKFKDRGLKGVMHAYSGEYAHYSQIRDYGDFMFGIGGVATYKNSGIDDVIRRMSPDHIVLETDCPYLTPVPFRGKRNQPKYIVHTLHKIAEITGIPAAELAETTTRNARRLFGIN